MPTSPIFAGFRSSGYIAATGNSFATPHITGLVARILAKHPTVTVFQLKTILYALASNATTDPDTS